MTDVAAPIDRLRTIAARLSDFNDVDAGWFKACLSEYETGAPLGLSMEHAFGLACTRHGERPWWAIEAQQCRDELIREIDARRFAQLPIRKAARDFWSELSRYQTAGWRRDRAYLSPPSGPRGDLFRLLKLAAPLSEGTIRRALAGSRNPPIREPRAIGG